MTEQQKLLPHQVRNAVHILKEKESLKDIVKNK